MVPELLALFFSAVALFAAGVSLGISMSNKDRLNAREARQAATGSREMEREAEKASPGFSSEGWGRTPIAPRTGNQSVPGGFSPVPDTPPEAVAPGLKHPPKPKGGFGSKSNAPQFPTDSKAGGGQETTGS